jgi:predicted O-methyltransferase YrrM
MNVISCLLTYKKIKGELMNLVVHDHSSYDVAERVRHAIDGSIKIVDALILNRLLSTCKPVSILEVGSFLGFSTRWLLEVSRDWHAMVTAVDPNIRHRVYDSPRRFVERLNAVFLPDRLEIISGFFGDYTDDIYYDYEHYKPKKERMFVNKLIREREQINSGWQKKYDFIFIDGDHSYKSVMNNFELSLALLKPGGCIAFHDALSWEGVNRALKELRIDYYHKAEVKIMGKLLRRISNPFFHCDGIGLFQLSK